MGKITFVAFLAFDIAWDIFFTKIMLPMLKLHFTYSMWTKVIPFPPSSLYISYRTIYFHIILMKSFLIGF